MTNRIVIIGAGHGGVQVAFSLREEGFEEEIVVISDENDLPYQKPPLSKGFLGDKQTVENLLFRNILFYEESKIQLVLGEKVTKIDVKSKTVSTQNNLFFEYGNLVIATGARNRKLPFLGGNMERSDIPNTFGTEEPNPSNVLYLRNLSDAQWIKSKLETANKVVVIGGGFIGLEVAAAAVEMGKTVTVIEAQERLMNRVLPPILSNVFLEKHTENNVSVLLNRQISNFDLNTDLSREYREGCVSQIFLTDKTVVETDLILVGIGVLPNSELAEAAGLTCENGIVVNEYLQTSDPSIWAIGDCTFYHNDFAEKKMRVESVQNAVDQAKCVASNILGKKEKYHAVPWFWTNQYDLKLQMAGIALDFDTQILRGSIQTNKFSIFYFKNKKLIGVDSLNRPADHLVARKLLQAGISPTFEQVEDTLFKLNDLISNYANLGESNTERINL
jgi:3-phenylpropionate/trans-cinnamate dioxygenase ferredoxin reductase component